MTPNELITTLWRELREGTPPFEFVVAHPDADLKAAWRASTLALGMHMLEIAARYAPVRVWGVARAMIGEVVVLLARHDARLVDAFAATGRAKTRRAATVLAYAVSDEWIMKGDNRDLSNAVWYAAQAVRKLAAGDVFEAVDRAGSAFAYADVDDFDRRERRFVEQVAARLRRLPAPTWAAILASAP